MGVAVGVAVDLLTLGVAVSIADPLPTNSLMTMGFVSIRLVCLYARHVFARKVIRRTPDTAVVLRTVVQNVNKK